MKHLVIAAAIVAATAATANAGEWVKETIYKDVKVCSSSSASGADLFAGALLGGIIGNNIGDGKGNGAAGALIGTIVANESGKRCHWERRPHGHRWVHVE